MTAYIVQRLLGACASLCAVAILSFLILRSAPGGPFDLSQPIPPESLPGINKLFPADASIFEQIQRYFLALLEGDFGPSLVLSAERSAGRIVAGAFPLSLCLSFGALSLALTVGLLSGVAKSRVPPHAPKHARSVSTALLTTLTAGVAIVCAFAPELVAAPLFALAVTAPLPLPDSLGWRGLVQGPALLTLFLPMLILGLSQIAPIAGVAATALREIQSAPAFLTAQTKGLPHNLLIRRHALPMILAQVAGRLGPVLAAIVVAQVIVEPVFDLPGLGMTLQKSLANRDYTVTIAALLVFSTEIILVDALGAVLQGWFDPRVPADITPWPTAILTGEPRA